MGDCVNITMVNAYYSQAKSKEIGLNSILKKPKFDPKTFQPFDKVLVKIGNESYYVWFPDFISLPPNDVDETILCMNTDDVVMAIPYNNDTKHLVGTTDEAPEFYRY